MSAKFPPVGCGTPTEIVFRGIVDLRGQEHPTSASAQGADEDVHLCSLVGTPVPKGLSNSSDNVIVERTPTLVRKVTVLKRLPEHRPVPSCERSVVVKSTKLFPGSHYGSHHADLSGNTTGGKKPAKELILKTDKENLPKEREEVPVIKSKEQAEDEIFKLINKDYTDIDGVEEKNLSEQSGSRAKKEYVKLQIQKRKRQQIQDLIKKREQEEAKLKNLKELKDKQLKLVQNNVRRARQKQQQQQQQQWQQDQEAAEVTLSKGQCQQWTHEEILSKIKENAEVNITLKNMVATMQKELKGFGHQRNKEVGETPVYTTCITMRNKDSVVSSEQLVPNSGDFTGKHDKLKKLGPQNESDMDIPLNDSKPEALPYHFGVEPVVPLLAKEVKKGVTKTLKEYFEASKRKHLAALKIQAVFRGYQVRKMMKKINELPLKNNNYANTETVDGLRIKCLPATSAELETGSASLIHEKFRSRDSQQLNILVKKEVTKILKDMDLKVSIDSDSKLESPVTLQPKISVAAKEHVKPKANNIKKTNIMVRKEVTKTLKEFMETRKKQELAATKIQAAFRGYRTRKLHNVETKTTDKYTLFKGFIQEVKNTESPNRQSISVRSDKSKDCDGYLKTAEFSSFLASGTEADPLLEWLKPMYIELCPYNVMTAIQNTMLSRSGPRQPYWLQANREHMNERSKAAQTSFWCESGQALPVIDASKEKTRKQSTVHHFVQRDYEPNLATDYESMQCEDGLSVNSSALEAEHSSSDESRVRWKKRLSVTSPQEVLPSRVKPVHWSKSDSEIIIRPSFSAKLQKNFEKINMERNMRSFSSVGRPAVMPKKVKYRHYGLVPPDVELRRKKEIISMVPADSSCQAESSVSDTWDSHSVQHQHGDQPFHSAGIVHKAHKNGLTSRETVEFRHSDKKQDGGLHHIMQSEDKQQENTKGFQDKVGSDVKDMHEEKVDTQTGDTSRLPASGSRSISDIIKAGRMLHPAALHLRFQAEMNRLDSVEESRQRLTEIEAILAQSMQAKKESEKMQQAPWEVKTFREDKQVQAEPIIHTSRSHVQTQMPDRAHQLVQLMPCDQMKFPHRKAVEPFLEADFEQHKLVQVASSTHMQMPSSSEPKSLSQSHLLMPVLSNSHPEFRPIHSVLSSQIGTVPETLTIQTQVKHDSLQSLIPTHRHVSEASDIQTRADRVSMAGTSGAILDPMFSRLSVTQLLQEAERTRRIVTLDNNVMREAMSRRREHLMSELSVKYEQWDSKHKEFMKKIEKEDNEQLNRILHRKFIVNSNQPFLDVPACQLHQKTKQAEDAIRSYDSKQLTSCTPVAVEQQDISAAEPLLPTQQKFDNVNYKRGSDIVAEALSNIGKEVTDLERTVADNLVDNSPEQSFQTISEGISEKDDTVVRTRNKEVQDLSFSQTSSLSDVFISETDNEEKVSKIRESLHKIDKLIHEEKETTQKHVDLLNEKFRLAKERTRAGMKLLLAEIREHKEKGEDHLVPGLKRKQFSLLHVLEEARQDSKREYDKLLKATVSRKLALRQQKAIIKSYLKSVQLRGSSFQEGHRSTSELNGDVHKRSSVTGTEEEPVSSTKEDALRPGPKSELLEFSVTIPPQITATDDQVFSSSEANMTAADISLKQMQSKSEDKFNAIEESTDSVPQTEAATELSDLERRVRSLREQLRKKKNEAEKLRQEQQRKKKEQLRIKEQSLLKQIHAYDAYIDEIKKELEDKLDYSTDTSLPPGKLWIHDNSEHDAVSAAVSTVQSTGNILLKQKWEKYEENKSRTSDCGLVSGNCSQPVVTSVQKEMEACEFQVIADDSNTNTQLREDLQVLTNENHTLDNSSLETVLQSSISSSMKENERGLEELSEELEQEFEIVSVIEEEVQEEEEERDTELNSTVHDNNSWNSVQESLCMKPDAGSVIQELIFSKQCTSVQGTESAEEMKSVLEEVSECVTEIEENGDYNESLEQDLQDAGWLSDVLNHSEESVISSLLSPLKDSVQLGAPSVCNYEVSDVQEGILEVEEEIPVSVEEIENIPETEKETADSDEGSLKSKESSSLNVVSEAVEILFHKDFQSSDHTCDVNKEKEKADKKITEKVERITDIIFQKILKESLKTVCKDAKCHKSALKMLNGNECKIQIIEETVTGLDLSNHTFIIADRLVKQTEDKFVDRVDSITNAILEQLLAESSAIFCSKKSKIDSTGHVIEDVGSMLEEGTSTRDEVIAGTPTLTLGLPDRSGINIRKRVSEILAESSGLLSITKEKSRPQDFMITTYDILSPEEMSQPGSPSKEDLDRPVIGVTENLAAQYTVELEIANEGLEGPENEWFDEDYGLSHTRREAEELRLQQLQIEQEIQELEQAQEQLPYFYIREIPNKPPPPYTPPGQTVRSSAAPCKLDLTTDQEPHFIPFTADELSSLTVTLTSYLYDLQATSGEIGQAEVPSGFYGDNGTDIKSTSRRIFKKLVFDLTKDIIKETYDLVREKPCAPWDWPAFSHKRSKLLPRSREMIQEVILKQVLGLFGFAPRARKEKLVIRWSRKKRDYVDEILMKESHEEESAWTCYDEDEVTVKNEITLGILDSLLDETVQIILDIRKRKLSKS